MNKPYPGKTKRRQRGAAAVEAAVCLPILILFLAVPLFFARYFWHYTAIQKAAHDAARYLASAPRVEMLDRKAPLSEIDAAAFARLIANTETAELDPGPYGVYVEVFCGNGTCLGTIVPATVRVRVTMGFTDPIFPDATQDYGGVAGFFPVIDVTMPYVGH